MSIRCSIVTIKFKIYEHSLIHYVPDTKFQIEIFYLKLTLR